MRRSEESLLAYSLAAYFGASLLGTVLLLLLSLAAMKALFGLAVLALGPGRVYWLKPALYDSAGFALASGGSALLQYYLGSLLAYPAGDRFFHSLMTGFCALFCGALFWRGAAHSALGAYAFSGLAVTLAVLIGGLAAAFQSPSENPWRGRAQAWFR